MTARHVDVLVVGAGLAGVGAGWHLLHERPGTTFAILEAREAVGGTWDTFRFPGVRSDSDMQTLSYPFRPWRRPERLGGGAAILDYVQETARETGVAGHIRLGVRVVSASWSTPDARWTVEAMAGDERQTWTCSVLYACTGYYDHSRGYTPDFPGLSDFAGTVLHPQRWPEDLDLAGRRVVVIGSGATAITLVPALADAGAEVTMLQRSPSWVTSVGGPDPVGRLLAHLPHRVADPLLRTRNAATMIAFYGIAQRRPALARWYLRRGMAAVVGNEAVDAHFTPRYDPWDQRLCVAPDGDFLHAVADGRARVVTDHVERFEASGIRLASGRLLEADVVVTATGLSLLAVGGVALDVDGQPVDVGQSLTYRGAMLAGVPNFFVCIGYINASWTLRTEVTHTLVCRVLAEMERNGYVSATPDAPPPQTARPLMALSSGYVLRGEAQLPKQGDREPWTLPQNWFTDRRAVRRARLDEELTFVRRDGVGRSAS
ncbi:MAG: NAD(P)/FAD-dependent oxidoreductase [Lapillicoccus sp.]